MQKYSKLITLIFVALGVFFADVYGQNIKTKPFLLTSSDKDSIASELCGFKVPLDRTISESDSLLIYFVRLKSTNPNPGSPIVYLAGGPGSSGIEAAKGKRFPIFKKLREVSDVIILDQRGTGLSDNLPNCPYKAEFELDKPIERQGYVNKTLDNINRCLQYWQQQNKNVWAFNTTENAKDVDDLRKVLKAERISLWGISYGSHLAFEYIRLFDKNIDKVVLASLEGPDETIKYPKDTEKFLLHIAKLARDNYGSSVKYPNTAHHIESVHKRLKNASISVAVKNRTGGIDTVGISNFELQAAIATFYLKNPEDSKKIPSLYLKMYEGNFTEIVGRVIIMKKYVLNGIQPMPFAMDMKSGISEKRKSQVENQIQNSILGSTINFLFYEWIVNLKYEQLPSNFRVLKKNSVDALLFSGTMDGRTYLKSGFEIASYFKEGRHIVVENGGHDIYEQSKEVADEVFDFFAGKQSDKNKIYIQPIPFD